jgi:hypothetical protein
MDMARQRNALSGAIMDLSPELREIVMLHYGAGLNDREIGERLGIHRTTVRYHLRRAVSQCRGALQPWLSDPATDIRPSKSQVAAVSSVVAIAAGLSATSKAALAAQCASETAVANSALIGSSLLKNLMAAAYAGAFIMASKTAVVGTVSAAAIIGWGGYRVSVGEPPIPLSDTTVISKSQRQNPERLDRQAT